MCCSHAIDTLNVDLSRFDFSSVFVVDVHRPRVLHCVIDRERREDRFKKGAVFSTLNVPGTHNEKFVIDARSGATAERYKTSVLLNISWPELYEFFRFLVNFSLSADCARWKTAESGRMSRIRSANRSVNWKLRPRASG
jgi:hypothetical protein